MEATKWAIDKVNDVWSNRNGRKNRMALLLDSIDSELGRTREELASVYIEISGKSIHSIDCGTSNAPAMRPERCSCIDPAEDDNSMVRD